MSLARNPASQSSNPRSRWLRRASPLRAGDIGRDEPAVLFEEPGVLFMPVDVETNPTGVDTTSPEGDAAEPDGGFRHRAVGDAQPGVAVALPAAAFPDPGGEVVTASRGADRAPRQNAYPTDTTHVRGLKWMCVSRSTPAVSEV